MPRLYILPINLTFCQIVNFLMTFNRSPHSGHLVHWLDRCGVGSNDDIIELRLLRVKLDAYVAIRVVIICGAYGDSILTQEGKRSACHCECPVKQ